MHTRVHKQQLCTLWDWRKSRMKIFECKCGSKEVFIEQQGNNCGLYCADCGKWLTWLNKDSKRLAERQIKGIEKEIRNKAIDDFHKKIDAELRFCSGYPNCGEYDYAYEIAFYDARNKADDIAEQLKAGDNNG